MILETKMKQLSSDRTKGVMSQFIWQLLSFVIAILNSPFMRFRGKGTILSTKGCSPLPSKTSNEDQMSRREREWWKDKQGGWGGGEVSVLCEKKVLSLHGDPDRNVPGEAAPTAWGHTGLPLIYCQERQRDTVLHAHTTPALFRMLECKYLVVGE